MSWPEPGGAESFAPIADREHHALDVYLEGGRPTDVQLDGASVHPTWFKLEFKENGEVSAKVKGVRLSTRLGDAIRVHAR